MSRGYDGKTSALQASVSDRLNFHHRMKSPTPRPLGDQFSGLSDLRGAWPISKNASTVAAEIIFSVNVLPAKDGVL